MIWSISECYTIWCFAAGCIVPSWLGSGWIVAVVFQARWWLQQVLHKDSNAATVICSFFLLSSISSSPWGIIMAIIVAADAANVFIFAFPLWHLLTPQLYYIWQQHHYLWSTKLNYMPVLLFPLISFHNPWYSSQSCHRSNSFKAHYNKYSNKLWWFCRAVFRFPFGMVDYMWMEKERKRVWYILWGLETQVLHRLLGFSLILVHRFS